jgi:hypothetical protein
MVAISFSIFKDKLLSGEKTQTIRPYNEKRFNQIKRIGKLQIYWKQRSKECEKLFDAELTEIFKLPSFKELYEHHYVPVKDLQELAQRDGFECFHSMLYWFRRKYGEKFWDMEFMVIRWKRLNEVCKKCGKQFKTKAGLRSHERMKHGIWRRLL